MKKLLHSFRQAAFSFQLFALSFTPFAFSYSQVTVVVHKDANYANVAVNTAAKLAAWSGYQGIADNIQKLSDSIVVYEGIILAANTMVNTALTDVSSLESQAHAVVNAWSQIQDIVKNVATASTLAVGKPYLVQEYSQFYAYVMGRITNFQSYLTNMLTPGDSQTQMDKQQRDQLVWRLCNEINGLDNYTQSFIQQIKMATFADAIKSAGYTIPFQSNQTQILKNLLSNYKL